MWKLNVRGVAAATLTVLILFLGTGESRTGETTCDVALVLADDVSGSMDDVEYDLLRGGYASAFRDVEVIETITGGGYGCIWVVVTQWRAYDQAAEAISWMRISNAVESKQFATVVAEMPRLFDHGMASIANTCTGCGLRLGIELLEHMPFVAVRRVLDMSGDGDGDDVADTRVARDVAIARRITINGLIVGPSQYYYEQYVVGGPGSFLLSTGDYQGFAESIKRKLILEIAGRTPDTPFQLAYK